MRASHRPRIFVRNVKYFRSCLNVTNPLLVGNGASRKYLFGYGRPALATPGDSLERDESQIGGESSILCSLQAAVQEDSLATCGTSSDLTPRSQPCPRLALRGRRRASRRTTVTRETDKEKKRERESARYVCERGRER